MFTCDLDYVIRFKNVILVIRVLDYKILIIILQLLFMDLLDMAVYYSQFIDSPKFFVFPLLNVPF